jgi:hypothetical protein
MQDVMALRSEVREYAHWFAHESIKKSFGSKRTSAQQPELSPTTSEVLREWEAQNPLSRRSLDDLIEQITGYTNSAQTIIITLSAPPTSGLKKTLVAWCRQNVAPNILVTFQFNATLLGGMVVRYGSRIFDWSFRRQLLGARDRFPEVLRRV